MKRRLLFLFALLPLLAPGAARAESVPRAVLDSARSVLPVQCILSEDETGVEVANGSGFVVYTDENCAYIATNYHVVQEAQTIIVWVKEEEYLEVSLAQYNEDYDLALLRADAPLQKNALYVNSSYEQGDAVYAVGFPGAANAMAGSYAYTSEQATITGGFISALRNMQAVEDGPLVPLVQSSAPISPGSSGGPLLNESGHVVGINTMGVTNVDGIYGAIAVSELITLMRGTDLPILSPQTSQTTQEPEAAQATQAPTASQTTQTPQPLPTPKTTQKAKAQGGLVPGAKISLGIAAISALLAALLLWRRHAARKAAMRPPAQDRNVPIQAPAPAQQAHVPAGTPAYMPAHIPTHMPAHVATPPPAQDTLGEPNLQGIHAAQILNGERTQLFMRAPEYGIPYEPNASPIVVQPTPQPAPRRRRIPLQWVLIGVTLLIVAGIVLPVAQYTRAIRLMEQGDFIEAQRTMNTIRFAAGWFPEDQAYIDAGASLKNGEYEEAIAAFGGLYGYRSAATLLQEAKYQKACELISRGDAASARPLLQEIHGYKDADALLQALPE